MVRRALPDEPPRLACPTGRKVFVHDAIANVNLPYDETSLPAGQAGEGSRIIWTTCNLKTSAHVGQADMGRSSQQ